MNWKRHIWNTYIQTYNITILFPFFSSFFYSSSSQHSAVELALFFSRHILPFDTSWSEQLVIPKQSKGIQAAQHHRIECFGLEGTFRGHLAQPPCSEQGHLQLHQAAQSPVQPGLECFQGGGIYTLSGEPTPVFHHPHHRKFLPYIQSKSILP